MKISSFLHIVRQFSREKSLFKNRKYYQEKKKLLLEISQVMGEGRATYTVDGHLTQVFFGVIQALLIRTIWIHTIKRLFSM
jgi:hypothetical protein